MDRNQIEELLLQISKEPTRLKTVLDETQTLYEQELIEPKPEPKKRRKRDIRTVRRLRRAYYRKARDLGLWKPDRETLRRDFHKLRGEVLRRKRGANKQRLGSTASWEWKISLDEWMMMWLSCPMVEIGFNAKTLAWKARGRKKQDVRLKRIDVNIPWQINNLQIVKGKQVLFDGNAGI